MTRHTLACDADGSHAPLDCATASRLARLEAFAEAVRDEFACHGYPSTEIDVDGSVSQEAKAAHVEDCWSCYAAEALEGAR
jgi:hypothetical protein